MISQTLAARSACLSASSDTKTSSGSGEPIFSNFVFSSSSSWLAKDWLWLLLLEAIFLLTSCTLDTKDDFLLLLSLEEELLLEEEVEKLFLSPLRVLEERRLMEPLENSTSSEKETLEDLPWLPELLLEDDSTELVFFTGTTTVESELQEAQEATLSLATLGGLPSPLQKLSLAILEWPASRS